MTVEDAGFALTMLSVPFWSYGVVALVLYVRRQKAAKSVEGPYEWPQPDPTAEDRKPKRIVVWFGIGTLMNGVGLVLRIIG